ncbi:MAG: O-antigen ligase family protein [Chloroflexi bacterium]|nr:O-antigen ligase family protein [Chloroflexota bacterium]
MLTLGVMITHAPEHSQGLPYPSFDTVGGHHSAEASWARESSGASIAVARIHLGMEALWIIALLLVPVVVSPEPLMVFIETPKVAILRLVAVGMLGLWVWEWALTSSVLGTSSRVGWRSWGATLLSGGPSRWIIVGGVLFLLANVASGLLSPIRDVSFFGREFGRDNFSVYSIATYVTVFLAMATHLRRPEQVQRIMWAVTVAGMVAGAYGVAQHFGYDPLRTIDPQQPRVFSSFGNPIFFGSFLVMSIPISIATMLSLTQRLRPFALGVLVAALPIAVQVAGIVYSLSRGPWVGLAVALVVFLLLLLYMMGRQAGMKAALVILLAVGLGILLGQIPGQSAQAGGGSGDVVARAVSIKADVVGGTLNSRLTIWRNSATLLAERPWVDTAIVPGVSGVASKPLLSLFGYGPETFLYTYPLAGDQQVDGARHYHAHHFLVNTAVELGVVGFTATTVLMGAMFLAGLRYMALARRRAYPMVLTLALAGILAALSGRMLEQMTGVPQVSDLLLFWALAGILAAFVKFGPKPSEPAATQPASHSVASAAGFPGRWTRMGMASVVVLLLMGFTWEYNGRFVASTVYAASAGKAFQRGEYDVSLQRLDHAIDLSPDVSAYRLNRAVLFTALRDDATTRDGEIQALEAGQAELGVILDRNPLAHRPWAKMGEITRELGSMGVVTSDEAVRPHVVLSELLPGYWAVYNVLAEGYLAHDRPEDAIEPLLKALTIIGASDKSLQPLFNLGEALSGVERMDEAIPILEETLRMRPNHANALEAHLLLSELYVKTDEEELAASHLGQYYFILGATYEQQGQTALALAALRDSLDAAPGHPLAERAETLMNEILTDVFRRQRSLEYGS